MKTKKLQQNVFKSAGNYWFSQTANEKNVKKFP